MSTFKFKFKFKFKFHFGVLGIVRESICCGFIFARRGDMGTDFRQTKSWHIVVHAFVLALLG